MLGSQIVWLPTLPIHLGSVDVSCRIVCEEGMGTPDDYRINEKVCAISTELGGTISAEHGIGQSLRQRLPSYKDRVQFDLMRTVEMAPTPTSDTASAFWKTDHEIFPQ